MISELTFEVYGRPAPQGSKSPKGRTKEGRVIMVESSKYLPEWRETLRSVLLPARPPEPFSGPVVVRMVFSIAKPKSAPRKRLRPTSRPDTLKLARAVEDQMTQCGIWADDSLAVEYTRLAKVWAGSDDPDAMDLPGVRVWVALLEQPTPVASRETALASIAEARSVLNGDSAPKGNQCQPDNARPRALPSTPR